MYTIYICVYMKVFLLGLVKGWERATTKGDGEIGKHKLWNEINVLDGGPGKATWEGGLWVKVWRKRGNESNEIIRGRDALSRGNWQSNGLS